MFGQKAPYVVAAALLASSSVASAAETNMGPVILKLNGQVSLIGAGVTQSNMDGLDSAVLAIDSGFFGSASLPVDGVGEFGARVAFDLDYASNFDSFLNDAGSSNVMRELWAYWDSDVGRIQMGLQDGAADILGLGVPSVTRSIRVDNPEVFLLGYPCSASCSSDPQFPGSLFSPNGMQLRTDIHGSDEYLKIMYVTPNMGGLHIAVSYAPDGTRDPSQLFGDDELTEQGDIWDIAANYLQTVGEVDLGFSAGYVTGTNLNNPSPSFYDDLEEWGAAARVGYHEWTFGTAFRRTNATGGGPVTQGFGSNVLKGLTTDIWSFGTTWEQGPWMAGVNYVYATAELGFGEHQQGSGLQFAGAYTINEDFRVSAGYQHFMYNGPNGACPTDVGGIFFNSCDTLDGSVGYIETTFTF
jgi:hypothetical protein